MKKIACLVILAGWFAGSYATDARVFTMGGNDNFFMDDYSIFRNPGNINYYPNMLLGSPGTFNAGASDTVAGNYAGLVRKNENPMNPYFGLILSYSLNQASESGTQYPLLSGGLVLNRYDDMLDYINPLSQTAKDAFANVLGVAGTRMDSMVFLAPVGKIDAMAGYALQNGVMIGIGTYLAFQKQEVNGANLQSSVYRGNIGVNWPVAKSMNLEISAGLTSVTGIGMDTVGSIDKMDTLADGDLSAKFDIRLFSALTSLNGDFVPHFGINYTNLHNYSDVVGSLGLGVNVNIDKGFFWAGLEGLYEAKTFHLNGVDSLPSGLGGRISAGLERNVLFDWWVWRIGVSKQLMYVSNGNSNGHWEQNPESDGSDHDSFALGWGLNIENRLKIDVVMAEDMFYTFTNLISGSAHHLTNRITATYSF
jgi:hypothetical protein